MGKRIFFFYYFFLHLVFDFPSNQVTSVLNYLGQMSQIILIGIHKRFLFGHVSLSSLVLLAQTTPIINSLY